MEFFSITSLFLEIDDFKLIIDSMKLRKLNLTLFYTTIKRKPAKTHQVGRIT